MAITADGVHVRSDKLGADVVVPLSNIAAVETLRRADRDVLVIPIAVVGALATLAFVFGYLALGFTGVAILVTVGVAHSVSGQTQRRRRHGSGTDTSPP